MRCKNVLCGAAVSSARKAEQGEAFLPGVDMADIESLHAGSTDYKVKCMLQAAGPTQSNAVHWGRYPELSELQKVSSMCNCCVWLSEASKHTRREESWKAMPPLLSKKKNRLG